MIDNIANRREAMVDSDRHFSKRLKPREIQMRWDTATRYQILLKINNAVITRTSREELFQVLATELREHIPYDRLSINLYDANSKSMHIITLTKSDWLRLKHCLRLVQPIVG